MSTGETAEGASETAPTDIKALASGGRTNFLGFLMRLVARMPFLFIAGRLYGATALGRFAAAVIAVEFAAAFATLGLKRGLAQELAQDPHHEANIVADGVLLSTLSASLLALALWAFPLPMFPAGDQSWLERLLAFTIVPLAVGDVALAALAYKFDVATTVRARAVVEPWTLSIVAGLAWFVVPGSGLVLAYVCSSLGATLTALWPLLRTYGMPHRWRPHPITLGRLAVANLPLAGADAIEWGTRKLDLAILAQFAPAAAVGVYYIAQQVASLPAKLKTSFEPILGPVIARNLGDGNLAAIAKALCQVGFWITAAQAGVALALGLPAEEVLTLVGPQFVGGTGALEFLLIAEVVAATAVVSEAALIYIAPMRNLVLSLVTITLQGVLTIALITAAHGAPHWTLPLGWHVDPHTVPLVQAAAAALSLAIALAFASVAKGKLASAKLGAKVNNWRWALLWAAIPTVLLGYLFHHINGWVQLIAGVPAMLGIYCLFIWRLGFGPEDRVLFRRRIV